MTKWLTILCIALTPVILGVAYWIDPLRTGPWMLVTPALLLGTTITMLIKGNARPALLGALLAVSTATSLVAIHLIHQTESGREIMWRVASAIFR
jgi:hypothetical protein